MGRRRREPRLPHHGSRHISGHKHGLWTEDAPDFRVMGPHARAQIEPPVRTVSSCIVSSRREPLELRSRKRAEHGGPEPLVRLDRGSIMSLDPVPEGGHARIMPY